MPEIFYVPFERRLKYPHMMPADVFIWERYIDQNPGTWERVAYDVAVGQGTPLDTIVSPETGGDINRLYQRKIDVVAEKGNTTAIIEVKPRASTAALGQVRGYMALFEREHKPSGLLVPIIVTNELLPEMDILAKDAGVILVLAR